MLDHQLQLLNVASELLGVANSAGFLTYMNPAWESLLGFTGEELGAQPYLEFVHPDDSDATKAEADKALQGLPSTDFENRYTAKDGTCRWISWRMSASSERTELYLTGRDVTDQKQIEMTRAQLIGLEKTVFGVVREWTTSKEQSNLLAAISHQLRTPLYPILGWAQLLQSGTFNREKAQLGLQVIERNARQQLRTINDLLLAPFLLQGKLRIANLPINLSNVVSSALVSDLPAAKAKNIEIRADDRLPDVFNVIGDARRLEQAISNLISNAIKFTPESGIVSVILFIDGQDACVQIADTGKGISASRLPHIFKPFWQADASTMCQPDGIRLGLTISQQLIELHRGTVRVESPGEDKGTTVTVKIPLA